MAIHFVFSKCKGIIEGTVDSIEKLSDEVETVNEFCYLKNTLDASVGCEAVVTERVRIGWVNSGNVESYFCERSAMLYGSGTWSLKENEKVILRKTKRAIVRAMCGQKVVVRKTTKEQMDMLGLKETIDRIATANRVRWQERVLSRNDQIVLRVALDLEVSGKRKRERPKKTSKK